MEEQKKPLRSGSGHAANVVMLAVFVGTLYVIPYFRPDLWLWSVSAFLVAVVYFCVRVVPPGR